MDFERVLRGLLDGLGITGSSVWKRRAVCCAAGSSMLSDAEKRDLLQMAGSATVREEFRALKAASAVPPGADIDVDMFVAYLTAMNRILPLPLRPLVEHSRVLL